ncbi:hypothetical protein NQ317_016847 [Molorchus minor]|uniref:Uncharacterized protein n=1 Tax=Molorchus minor TaxID=1323400 RepID=A0ABQ9JIZ0_9CUCU|nr:hypothetical protein NQ317_016847 [Molorchus minor]
MSSSDSSTSTEQLHTALDLLATEPTNNDCRLFVLTKSFIFKASDQDFLSSNRFRKNVICGEKFKNLIPVLLGRWSFFNVDNIKRSYSVETRDGRRHQNGAMSLELWVQECKAMSCEENSVIFYKRQGEVSDVLEEHDFCLVIMNRFQQMMLKKIGSNVICIDGTHGLNHYEFELTTIMVIDEFGQGFPTAFMFSNKKEHTHI